MNAGKLSWRTAWRIAWRDLRSSRGKFLFIAFAIAVGVGSLAGVRGFGRAFRTMLLAEARTLMAADLMVRVFEVPSADQQRLFDSLELRGARRTGITETVSMITAGDDDPPMFCGIKAVDPALYPFYGEVKLDPAGVSLADVLKPDAIAISDDVFTRLPNLKVGSTIRLGEADFRIGAILRSEPDRMTGSMNVGARVMMSRAGLDRTGLVKQGSRAAQRHLFKLPPADPKLTIVEVRAEIQKAFPNALISDFRETHPLITSNLERSERFLSLVSLIALIIGALGVAATMHAHLQQRLDTIAIMKCLGARSSHIVRIFLAQTILVGLVGGLLGVAIGSLVQAAFPLLIARFFSIAPGFHFDFGAAAEALTIGLLTATLFTWPALLGIEQIRPLMILRRDVTPAASNGLKPWLARLSTIALIAALASWLAGTDRWRVGLYFAGGLVTSLLVLGGFAWLLLWLLRRMPRAGLPMTWRHGLANLYRPGNQAPAVLVSLGIGVMFTLTIYLIQHGMLGQIIANAPPNMPNVFLMNVTSREVDDVNALLKSHPGIVGKAEVVPSLAARLTMVNGAPAESLAKDRNTRRFVQTRGVSSALEPRPGALITGGLWWSKDKPAAGQVCVLDSTAKALKLSPGMKLAWEVGAQPLAGTVVCTFKIEEVRMGGSMDFIFSPGSLEGMPLQYFASLRIKQETVRAFQKESFKRFPSVTIINGADVVEIIQQVVDQIALVVRFISAFAILAGAIILASSVAATRFRRVKEVAILKTLGASRRTVATIFSVEFLILGAVAGLLGGLLATGFSNLLLVKLLEAKARVDWAPNAVAIVLSALIANIAGWLASARTLEQKPLAALRDE